MRFMNTIHGKPRQLPVWVLVFLFACAVLLAGCANRPSKAAMRKQADASRSLAEAYSSEGKFRIALRELLKAQSLDPENADVQYDLGLVYLALKQPEMAIAPFKRTIELRPNYSVAMNGLGAAYMALGRWDEAIPCFEQLLNNLLYATPQYLHLNLGFCYYNKKEYARSVESYKTAIEYNQRFAEAWRGLGRTYTAMGRLDEAMTSLEKAIQLAPRFSEAYFDLAQAYGKKGFWTKALTAYKKVVELAPGTPLAAQASDEMRNPR